MSEHIDIPSSPADRKKIQDALKEGAICLQKQNDQKLAFKAIADMLKENFSMPPKLTRKLAASMVKHNFSELQVEYENFESAYEAFIEGKQTQA